MRDRLQQIWVGFTPREQRLVTMLGGVVVLLFVFLVFYFPSVAIASLEAQNEEIATVLSEIDRASDRLAQRAAEAEAAERRYDVRAPALGSFVEARATENGVTVQQVTNQPEVEEGRFRRRHVRATVPNVSLRNAVHLLTELEGSEYPIALERIHVEHFTAGNDQFNFEIGVVTFDRAGASAAGTGPDAGVPAAPAPPRGGGLAGPPPPPP
jgi:hypothetical protein